MSAHTPDPSQAKTISLMSYFWQAVRRGTLWASAARWLRARGLLYPMSWEAYRFDEFRRQRSSLIPEASLARIHFTYKQGLVSIVLPVYNGESYIGEALESILAQSYGDWEVIAVDDGSTDNTGNILDSYALREPRIRVIHQTNKKLPGALNTGFKVASGEYLTWTSYDNCLAPDFLASLVAELAEHIDWEMVYANFTLIDPEGQLLVGSDKYLTYQWPYGSAQILLPVHTAELNTYPNNTVSPSFLYRQRAAALLGEYSPYRFTLEDYDYWMRINALLRLRHAGFSRPVYKYRFHSKSLTAKRDELKIFEKRDRLLIFDDFRRDAALSPMLWCIQATNETTPALAAEALRAAVQRYGHRLIDAKVLARLTLPSRWLPIIHARFSTSVEPELSPLPRLPEGGVAARISVSSGEDWKVEVLSGGRDAVGDATVRPLAITPGAEATLSALDIYTRSKSFAAIEAFSAAPHLEEFAVSVIVCTHRPGRQLKACLTSLALQSLAGHEYEVIVVNNSPTDMSIDAEVEGARAKIFHERPEQLRLVHCPNLGLSHARNAGLAEARGEVVTFIDDDALAQPEWLESLVAAFDTHPEAGVIGGRILLQTPQPVPWWLRPSWKRFWSHFDPPYSSFTSVSRWQDYPWGANWAARRKALLEIAGFRTRYGRVGVELMGGEEIIATSLIQRLGYAVGVEPAAVVEHHVDPERFRLVNIWRSVQGSRRAWYQMQKDGYIPYELGLRNSVQRVARSIAVARSDSFFKLFYTLFAEASLSVWLARDLIQRLRRPIAAQ